MHPVKTATELLEMIRLEGYMIEVKDGFLEVKEARWIDDEMSDLIRLHKTELIKILGSELKS